MQTVGFPSPAEDYIESFLDLNAHLISKPAATFFIRAKGESMIGSGIHDGDLLIIDRSIAPRSGNVVLAVLNGEFVLKRLEKLKNQIWLHSDKKPIQVFPEMEFEIWGVAIHCIHKLT